MASYRLNLQVLLRLKSIFSIVKLAPVLLKTILLQICRFLEFRFDDYQVSEEVFALKFRSGLQYHFNC